MAISYTNYVANSSYSYTTSGSSLYLTLTADDGYVFESAPYVYSFDGDFYDTDYMTLSSDSKTATLKISGYSDIETIAFYGSTVAESSGGGVVFDLTESSSVSYTTDSTTDEDNDTVTVNISLIKSVSGITFGLFNVKASYTDTSGETVTVDLDVTVTSTTNTVSATLTDVDTTQSVTVTGDAVYALYVNTDNSSNIETLPTLYNATEDITVTVTAYTGCYFADTPTVKTYSYSGTMTLNDAATEASITVDADTATTAALYGYELSVTAVAVVQENTDVTGCINIYGVTDSVLDEFATKRFYETTDTSSGYVDYAVYVAAIRKLYCTVDEDTEQDIMCGNYNTGITAPTISETVVTVKLGDVEIPQYNNNIVDYETKLTMFVPLYGLADIPTEYVGKTLSLQYVFDIVNGNGVAQILHNGICVMMCNVDSGVDVIYRTLEVYTNIENTSQQDNKAIYGLTPFVNVIYYTASDSNRQRSSGLRLLSELSGYYAFEYVTNLECAMLKEEYDMIIDLLKKGVYL